MNLNMRFPLSKNCPTTPKLHRYVFYIIYHKNNYQAYKKDHFLVFQHTLTHNVTKLMNEQIHRVGTHNVTKQTNEQKHRVGTHNVTKRTNK